MEVEVVDPLVCGHPADHAFAHAGREIKEISPGAAIAPMALRRLCVPTL
jgi:hypothetical protein